MRCVDYDGPVTCVGRFVSGTIVGNLSGLRATRPRRQGRVDRVWETSRVARVETGDGDGET